MGFFDDIPEKGSKAIPPVQGSSTPKPTGGGYFDDIPGPEAKKPSLISQAFNKTRETAKSFAKSGSSFGKGFVEMFTNPGEAQRKYEENYLPYGSKSDPIVRAITAPGVAFSRGVSRFVNPGVMPLAEDIAQIYEVSRKGGIADQVAEGKIPASYLEDIAVLKKSAPQIVGDVAQAVLTAYSGSAVKNVATAGKRETVKQAFKSGAKEAAPLGLLFGSAQVASEGITDPKEIATTLGVSTLTAGIMGGIVRGTVPASKAIRDKFTKLFKEKNIPVTYSKPLPVDASKPGEFMKQTIRDHLSQDGQVLKNVPPQELAKLGGEKALVVQTKKNIVDAITRDLGPDYAAKINAVDTTNISTLVDLETALSAVTPDVQPTIPIVPPKVKVEAPVSMESDVIKGIIDNGRNAPEVIQQARAEAPRFEPKQVAPEGQTITPALASRVETEAVEKGLTQRLGDLPEARTMNMKQQARDAANFVASDYQRAKRVAMGGETPPGELRDASVFEAVKQKALLEGDVQTLKELATESTVPGKLTAYGQEIKAADNIVDSTDPVELMQSVIKARERGAEIKFKKERQADLASVKKAVKNNTPKVQDWDTFISSIEC